MKKLEDRLIKKFNKERKRTKRKMYGDSIRKNYNSHNYINYK